MSDDGAMGAERRLHPLSWLFVLIQQLKQFIVPLLALLLFGRGGGQGDDGQWWPLIGVGVLALASIWQYLTYRYRIEADSLVVRSGVLHRSLRQIPFARIHNVALHQSLLHRMFGVAEVRLESAGGRKPEAQMRVLRLSDALALEALVRRRAGAAAVSARDDAGDAGTTLLQLPPAEVLHLGLVSNRGLIVIGGGFAALSQFNARLLSNLFEGWGRALFGWAGQQHFGIAQFALAGASLLLAFLLLLRLFSIALALLQYFGFRLDEHGRRLTVERGLLTRLRTSTSRRRIQAWTLREGLVHRWLGRRSLQIDTAVAEDHGQQRALRELAPIAAPGACDALVRHLLPRATWPLPHWQPLHPRAWLRLCLPGALLAALASVALGWRFGAGGLLALLWLPWATFVARQHARRAGYACDGMLVAWREGWWSRHWRFAELDKLQALQLTQSPLDRGMGMATLWLDTAGAGALSPPLRLRYLPEGRARALHAQLGHDIARRKLRW